MPVVEGQVFLQVALVSALIGLLGLVLRWTFRRDSPRSMRTRSGPEARPTSPPAAPAPPEPANTAGATKGGTADGSARARPGGKRRKAKSPTTRAESPAAAPTADERAPATAAPATPEDYGLLAVAAEVATAEDATKLQRVLTVAGIRSTNAVTGDGRHKVLVFGDELIKARRVAGGSQGAGGGQTGSSGS